MKKLFFVLSMLLIYCGLVLAGDLVVYDKVEGTSGVTFNEESTGGWDAIELPSTVENCRHVLVQVNDGSGSVTDTREAFLWSFDSDGSDYFYSDSAGVYISIGKKAGEIILYVKCSAANQDITVAAIR